MELPDATRRVTMRDVARSLDVSPATVSFALRNDPRISAKTRARVHEKAAEMSYEPNATATALAHHKRTSTTGPVHTALAWLNAWPEPKALRRYGEFNHYWTGARALAAKFGYHLEEFICGEAISFRRLEQILLARGIQGILLPPHQVQPAWGAFHWERFVVVRLGRSIETPEFHVVTADQVANTWLAFEKMRAHGYRRIGLLEGHKTRRYGRLFKAGFLHASSEVPSGMSMPVFTINGTISSEADPALQAWLQRECPDALLTDTALAPGMLEACGYRVPQHIALAATSVLDGNADAGIDQHSEEIGRVAMLTLISLIHDRSFGIPAIHRETLVKGAWVDGASLPPAGG